MKYKVIEEYEPFGPEWEAYLMKLPKKFIIDLYRRQCQEKFCTCNSEIKTGWTSAKHCNMCGKLEPEETWLK